MVGVDSIIIMLIMRRHRLPVQEVAGRRLPAHNAVQGVRGHRNERSLPAHVRRTTRSLPLRARSVSSTEASDGRLDCKV